MNKVFIIAEAGVNHNGSIELAKKLIDVASESGADAVKFQTFKAEKLVSKNAQKADYQKQTTSKTESQFDMIKKLELDLETHKELISYCKTKNIMFLSTPFDHESIDLLNGLGIKIFKIPKPDAIIFLNVPYQFSKELLKKKNCRGYIKNAKNDKVEKNRAYQKKAYQQSLQMVKKYNNWIEIDCVAGGKLLRPEEISELIWSRLEKFLGRTK